MSLSLPLSRSKLLTSLTAHRITAATTTSIRASRPLTARAIHSYNRQTRPLNSLPRPSIRMSATTAESAHAAFATQADIKEIKPGDKVPDVAVRIDDLEATVNFSTLPGKNVLVLVPGAFTPTCSSQVPSYIELYDEYKAKGVDDIYVVSVNDIFVVNAWKKSLLEAAAVSESDTVKFTGDDQAKLASALGLVLDAQGLLGGPRLKRGVIVIDNGKVVDVIVEENPGVSTVSQADAVIKTL